MDLFRIQLYYVPISFLANAPPIGSQGNLISARKERLGLGIIKMKRTGRNNVLLPLIIGDRRINGDIPKSIRREVRRISRTHFEVRNCGNSNVEHRLGN